MFCITNDFKHLKKYEYGTFNLLYVIIALFVLASKLSYP